MFSYPKLHTLGRGRALALVSSVLVILNCIAAAAEKPSGGKHFLWRVTNAPAPFYLLGSYHALRPSDYPLATEIDQAISQCKRVILESDEVDSYVYGKKLREAALYPNGVNLKQKVRPETYAALLKVATMRISQYSDIKPWAIAMFLGANTYMQNVYGSLGVEEYVLRKAGHVQRGGLETVDEHLHVLSDMTDIESEVMLLQSMVYASTAAKRFDAGVACWKRGDTQGLVQVYAAQDREAPFITWRLVDHRNAQWIPKIESAIKSGKPTMIVVGARHLCGPHNVVGMLQKRGYKLEQL